MKGSVDKITAEGSVGWLYAEAYGHKPLVQAFLRHRLVGQSLADLYRPDLEQVGLGDGRHGFDIRFDEEIEPGQVPFICLRPEGYDLDIPQYGEAGFLDLVARINAAHPHSGRNRSLLGGLWTDRVDALQILSGRIAVGTISADLQSPLSAFISHGHLTLNKDNPGRPLTERERKLVALVAATNRDEEQAVSELRSALSSLAEFVFAKVFVNLLNASFDDYPVIYRMDLLTGPDAGFRQAAAIEQFPSPAECALVYIAASAHSGATPLLEFIRSSHEIPEFRGDGVSRWTRGGASMVADFVTTYSGAIDFEELRSGHPILVGPGLIHRLNTSVSTPVLRIVLAPRRVTPLRYLIGEGTWFDVVHESGARVRL